MLFHFEVESAYAEDHCFHVEAVDLMEAHVKAIEFVKDLDAAIKRKTNGALDGDLKLVSVSSAPLEMADSEAIENFSDFILDCAASVCAEDED